MKKKILLFLLITLLFIPKLYAVCEEGSYKVTYDANGGTGASAPVCVTDTLSSIKPKRSGYKFLGWTTDKKSKTVLYLPSGEIELTGDITLYAVWGKKVAVTFDANGGTPTETYNMYQGENYKKIYTPKRKGYKFLGWYTKETDGELVDSTTLVRKTKDHTLYAHWKKITYTINYELNGGTNNENNKTKYSVTTKTFALSNPTKKGYTFKGWYKDSEFKKSITSITKGSTGNKTLYAKWSVNKYIIVFDGNGAKNVDSYKQTIKYNKEVNLTKNKFTRKGKVFAGWTKVKNGEIVYEDEALVKNLTSKNKKEITLYAKWVSSDTIEKNNFINDAKEVYHIARNKWLEDSSVEPGDKTYSDLAGAPGGYSYLIVIDETGDVIGYYITNGKYEFLYQGSGLQVDDIVAEVMPVDKKNFINNAKEIYHIAQNKWIEDSILEVGGKSYTELEGAPEGYTYSITINNEGNVINYYVANGEYEYEYEGLGLSMNEIIAVSILEKKNNFINDAKEVYHIAQNKWIEDSILEVGGKSYSDLAGVPGGYSYLIVIDETGDVIGYYITNGRFEFMYQGSGLQIKDITASVMPVRKRNFINNAKEMYHIARNKWVTDCMLQSSTQVYDELEGAPEGYTYSITINNEGNVINYYVANGEYEYEYEGLGLSMNEIIAVSILEKKNKFIDDAKEVYHIAQNKWIEDSILEVGGKSYSDLAGVPGGYSYLIVINNEGNVTNYYITNGRFEFMYEGSGLQIKDITASVMPVRKRNFINGAKEIYHLAQIKWMTDCMIQTSTQVYDELEGAPEGYTYSITINNEGNVINYYVANGEYEYEYEGLGLSMDEIIAVAISLH